MMKRMLTLAVALMAWPVPAQEAGSGQSDAVLIAARNRMNQQDDAWFHNGDFLPVIQNQEILVQLNPHDEETWSNLIWMYQNVENPEMQWLTARRFAKENPGYIDARYYEAQFLFSKRMYAKVPPLLEPAIKKTPAPDPNAFRFLAHAYNKMGYYKDAIRVWDAYLKVKPNDAQAKVNRNRIAEALKKK